MRDGRLRLRSASSFGRSRAETLIARLVDSDMSAHIDSPTAGSIIILDQHEYVLLDDPASRRRLWQRGSRADRLLFRACYDHRSWGRQPLYVAPINPATCLPYGLPEGIVAVIMIPVWAAIHGTGTSVPSDALRLARKRCVPYSDSFTGRSIVEDERVLIQRLNAAMKFVHERLLRQ